MLGSTKQEVVAILLPNSIEFITAYLSVVHSGHIALLLDPAYKSLELDSIIDQIPPKLIITNREYQQKLTDAHQQIAVLDDELNYWNDGPESTLRLPANQQLTHLIFTSGTTGLPKAVPNTHSNLIWNVIACSQVWEWTHSDTLLINVPLTHMLGIAVCLPGALYHGNTIYLERWFDAHETLQLLASGKISFFSHSASAYIKLLQSGDEEYDLSSVRLCVSGAAPLPPSVWKEFKNRYGIEILETYGSSETGRIAGNTLKERRLGSPGKPLPGVEVRLNKHHELEVKSGGVFPGYYKNKEATAQSRTPDGFWRTGDLAEIKDGYIFLKGRVQERIKKSGYIISPRDVEWAMHKLPSIKDILVMGNQITGRTDDEIIYFVVGDITDDEINAYCKQNLLFAWRPDKIIHLDDLPRSRSGKPQIKKLKELAA